MTPRRLAALTTAIALCLSLADGATAPEKSPYESYLPNSLSFSALGFKVNQPNGVGQLQADGANRVWATTDKGVAAILVNQLAPFFPLTKFSDGLLGDQVDAVAFGKLGQDENFFLGYGTSGTNGIQYGRVLSDTGLQPKPPNVVIANPAGALPSGGQLINRLSTNGGTLWAATQGGLVPWGLSGGSPAIGDVLLKTSPVSRVATDPWAAADPQTVYSSGVSLYAVPSENAFDNSLPQAPVALAFDSGGQLWVATAGKEVYRYPFSGDPTSPYGARLGPYTLNDGLRTLSSITVDPLNPTGTVVWVGTDAGAFFQVVGPSGDLTPSGWVKADTGAADHNVIAYTDPSGNLWFGSDFGVRSLLSRLVTISSTRFVGYGAGATIDLVDVNPNAPDAAPSSPPDTLTVNIVKQGGSFSSPELSLTANNIKTSDGKPTSSYRATFTFAPTTGPGQLGVTSSTANVIFEVAYQFGPMGNKRELPRPSFSWANIVKFQDDAWIGGPCFMNTLGR